MDKLSQFKINGEVSFLGIPVGTVLVVNVLLEATIGEKAGAREQEKWERKRMAGEDYVQHLVEEQ